METIKYDVEIKLLSGLHIGSGNSQVEIGGMDQPVIKDKNGYPYIPASSLKGKLRSLYEISLGKKQLNNNGFKEFDGKNYDEVSMFFGKTGTEKQNLDILGPTRFIFRDLRLENPTNLNSLEFLEEKTEVAIDRTTGTAMKSGPRPLERVVRGSIFKGELIVRLFDNREILQQYSVKNEKDILINKFGENLSILKKLLENDYLGGQGTRGSGEIEINFTKK